MDTATGTSEAVRREHYRVSLRRDGWTHWREENEYDIPYLLVHTGEVYSAEHERGPLLIWQHPAGCDCIPRWTIWEVSETPDAAAS